MHPSIISSLLRFFSARLEKKSRTGTETKYINDYFFKLDRLTISKVSNFNCEGIWRIRPNNTQTSPRHHLKSGLHPPPNLPPCQSLVPNGQVHVTVCPQPSGGKNKVPRGWHWILEPPQRGSADVDAPSRTNNGSMPVSPLKFDALLTTQHAPRFSVAKFVVVTVLRGEASSISCWGSSNGSNGCERRVKDPSELRETGPKMILSSVN